VLDRRNIGGAFAFPSYGGTLACICNNKINNFFIPSPLLAHQSYSYLYSLSLIFNVPNVTSGYCTLHIVCTDDC